MKEARKAVVLGGCGLLGGTLTKILSQTHKVIVVDKQNKAKLANYRRIDIFTPRLHSYLLKEKPNLVVNAVNIATITTAGGQTDFKPLVQFYADLYETLDQLPPKTTYLQLGTTGSGGLGIDIPFTHGEKRGGLPILYKAAAAGAASMLLVLASRSLDKSKRVIEVKPGLSIFSGQITADQQDELTIVTLNGGESGHYTYNEIALLTTYMGFTTVEKICRKILAILKEHPTPPQFSTHNVTAAIDQTIISETSRDRLTRARLLRKMRRRQGDHYLIATGNLGPPAMTKQLLIGALLARNPLPTSTNLWEAMGKDAWLAQNLAFLEKTKPELYQYLHHELDRKEKYLAPSRARSEPYQYARDWLLDDLH